MGGWRGWLINRVTLTFGALALLALGWNLYVAAHDDGILEGRVVDAPASRSRTPRWCSTSAPS